MSRQLTTGAQQQMSGDDGWWTPARLPSALTRVSTADALLERAITGQAPAASVVVPTYKRPELLDRCLSALLAQDYDHAAFEIVVADDAAGDETREQVNRVAAYAAQLGLEVRYVPVTGPGHGPGRARNAGWRAARGEIIAFTDDDCIPSPGWLRAGLDAFEDGVAGVMGRTTMPLETAEPTDYELNAAGLEGAEFITANCFYRRSVLEEVGGFDPRFEIAYREDTDIWFALIKRSKRLERAPAAHVVHPIRPARWGVSLQQQKRSMYNMLLYKKHPDLYIQRVAPGPPWHYYRMLVSLLGGLVALLLGRKPIALLGIGAWAYMTGRFVARRLERTSRSPSHVAEMVITSILIPPLSIYWRLRGVIRYRVRFL